MKSTSKKFRPYNQYQLMAIPPTLDELISKQHPVRVVNQVIDSINLDILYKKYQGGGRSSCHPRMLLKVLVYSYLSNIYSSRKMEAAVKENIHFMWLAGMEKPDHNTINRFRSDRLKSVIKKVFCQVVLLMVESGHVDLQSVYTDGTKIESKANRYTFVWGKRIKSSRERIAKQLEELWNFTQQVASEELKDTIPTQFEQMNPDDIQRTIDQINEALNDKPIDKKIRQKINYAKKKRPVDVEPVFGMIKQNRNFRRFLLKGIEKVSIEMGLLLLAHNLRKMAAMRFSLPLNRLFQTLLFIFRVDKKALSFSI